MIIQAGVQNPARGLKVEKHHPEGKNKTYDVLSVRREHGNGTKILGKSESSISKGKTKTKKDIGSC